MGIGMTLENSWGGDITTAVIAHLAHSTPEEFRFTSTDFNSYVSVSNASGAPQRVNGCRQGQRPGSGSSRASTYLVRDQLTFAEKYSLKVQLQAPPRECRNSFSL
jgi:hypothetical protein